MGRVAPDRWKLQYFRRIKDLIDQYQPDLLYTDGGIPFDEYGYSTVAQVYNVSAAKHNGKVEAVYFSKQADNCADRHLRPRPRTRRPRRHLRDPLADRHLHRRLALQTRRRLQDAKEVIDLLVDIVSKNGNLLLNFPLPNSGELDFAEREVLAGITAWMAVNSEGIYATRPWKIYGEGPSTKVVIAPNGKEFDPNEGKKPDLTASDIRFTTKGSTIYAFIQGWPEGTAVIPSLGTSSPQNPPKITGVAMLGHNQNLKFTQDPTALNVTLPSNRPPTADIGITLKIATA